MIFKTYEPKKIYLCKPDSDIHVVLNGVRTDEVSMVTHLRDHSSLTFIVDRFVNIDGEFVESNGYELLHNHMELFLPEIGYFQMQEPTITNDGNSEYKTVVAYSCDKELEDKDYIGLKINTGESDSMEYLAANNIDDLGFAKKYVEFYNPENHELSLLHIVLEKVPAWSVEDDDIDPLIWDKKIQINEDNINIYGLLVSTVAPKAECVFLFDILNRKIKVYSKNSLEFDTNVYIGLRNLEKTINVTVDENSIFTRFNVAGDGDLDITRCNFGDRRIFDLSWFMTENYMSPELIEKIKTWVKWRDENRDGFGDLSRQIADKQEKIDEIVYRVPSDDDYWKKWDSLREDVLNENLLYYKAMVTALQVSVDDNPQYDSSGNYIPWSIDGGVNHEKYMALLKDKANGYGGYYSYMEIILYIIPNIQIAILNAGKTTENKQDYIEDYETNWALYGIEELEGKKSDYESRLTTLKQYAKPWDELTAAEKGSYADSKRQYGVAGRDEYERIYNLIGYSDPPEDNTINSFLNAMNAEKEALEAELAELNTKSIEMTQKALISNDEWGLTTKEKYVVDKLMLDTDYTNNNIVTTSLTDTDNIIDVSKELFTDASDKLYESAQPQFKFVTELENLMEIEEFHDWIDDIRLLNYIHVGIRDDYTTKLRIVGYTFNPCEKKPELTLEFSNMINSRTGRTDLNDLLDNSAGASKNSITLGSSTKIDQEFATTLLQQMVKTGLFNKSVQDILNVVTVSGDTAQITNIVSEYIKSSKIDVGQIIGDEADFNKVLSQYISSDMIVTGLANIDSANVDTLFADNAFTEQLRAISSSAVKSVIDEAYIYNAIVGKLSVSDLKTGNIVLSDSMQITSENGSMVMNGKALQIKGTDSSGNEYIGIQLGYDSSENPSLILKNESGATVLTPEGITANAIADGLIINNMIGDGQIGKTKLGFKVVEANEHGGLDISEIYDGNEKFGAQYTQFKNETLKKIESIENGVSYSVSVSSDSLDAFDVGTEFSCTLSCAVKSNNDDITANVPEGNFTWKKISMNDPSGDSAWNSSHKGMKSVVVSNTDVSNTTTFICTVTTSDGVVVNDSITILILKNGANGNDGKDAIVISIESSAGTVFNEGDVTTTLTAHVYKGGAEISGAELDDLGTINWYKDDDNTAIATGQSYTLTEQALDTPVTYTAKLEG